MPPPSFLSRRAPVGILAALLLLTGCGADVVPSAEGSSATVRPTASPRPTATPTPSPSPTPRPLQGLALEVIAAGLAQPLDVRARPGDGTLFVAEQAGVIRRVTPAAEAAEEHPVMLDIRDAVNSVSIEQGLLGFAFHPDYPADPRVFVFHSLESNDNVLASYATAGDPDVLDPATRRELLTIDKDPDQVRHNGGTVLFGPDGMLYLSLGDAARAGLNGQDPATLPSTILRLNVDAGDPYAIPPDNPFAAGPVDGVAGAPEVWWYGLRNPWRFSLDPATGLAYVGDVGQERAEEIDVAPLERGGLNFGWPSREGFTPFLATPLTSEPIDPIIEIVHDDADRGCSVTGGHVYRGAAIPELQGTYFYADWCFGWIRSLRYADGAVSDERDWTDQLAVGNVSSFGVDADGEILVLDWQAGTLSRIVPVREPG